MHPMLILAHRGAHDPETPGVRENTLEAFRAARAADADGVELDVRLGDGDALWIHHDRELPDLRPAWLPTLDEAMEVCSDMPLVNVEIKADGPADPASLVAAHLKDRSNVLVSSFNLISLDSFHQAAPDIKTGWLTLPGYDQVDALATAAQNGHTALNPPDAKTTRELVDRTHAAGLRIVVWTVNDPARMRELADWGVDVLVTDRPRLAVQALR
jgi:glycerophosphoryl diester phosphodiesterase